jgi:1,2-dihydroxy-3-keto-5-methylthiopentene dioxygenase
MPKAYYIDNNEEVDATILTQLGVLYWKIDADNWEKEGILPQICKDRGYTYKDFVNSNNIPNLKEKLAIFFEEHLHDDEEIRFFVDGSGFFDVRNNLNENDR